MLSRIKRIINVGNFKNYSSEESIQFKKLTLIYGENGSGKSTICEILRSLSTNNPEIITSRRTLGIDSSQKQNVELVIDEDSFKFEDEAWSKKYGNIRLHIC